MKAYRRHRLPVPLALVLALAVALVAAAAPNGPSEAEMKFEESGQQLYGNQWKAKRARIVSYYEKSGMRAR